MAYEYEDIAFDEDIDLENDIDYEDMASNIHDGVDLEKLIASISKAREEVEFLKKLKKKRVEPIDAKIAKLSENEEKMKDFILELMPVLFPKKNTVDFPGVGKISKRKTKGKWEVTDEDAFAEMLKKHGMYDEVMKVKATVDKRKVPGVVSKILTEISEDDLEGVEFQEPEKDTSLVLKLYEDASVEDTDDTDLGF